MTLLHPKNLALKQSIFTLILVLGFAYMAVAGQVYAQDCQKQADTATKDDISGRAFKDWIKSLRTEARGAGISDRTLDSALSDVSPVKRVIELDRHQPEFTRTFHDYLRRRVNPERIKRGRAMLSKHRGLLEEIFHKYGVPPRYIIAFWGLETNFGDHLGSFKVVDALVTLAYDQRRADFFRGQLLDALRIIEQGHIEPDEMTGSWAGAMGHMQFLPSTFTGHAVDYTGDGSKDIWNSLPDAFASAANFLSSSGWQPGQSWGRQVILPENFDFELASLQRKKTIEEWSKLGVRRTDGTALPQADMEASLILPQGHKGPAFLVYKNFRVIMRWNRSVNYAISVGHLADRIVGMPPIKFSRNAKHKTLSHNKLAEIQQLLNRLGFDAGPEDGLPGTRTSAAIRAFQKTQSLPQDGYPSPLLLECLRAQ
ncbi:MAG: lytic murein transglycosylase [Desulfobacterales bacterium]|nr:lytic murein transglycosylase [Desulfobacterales bacterium]